MKKIILLIISIFITSFICEAEGILINYHDDAQSEIIAGDVRILIDIEFPNKISSAKTYNEEILLTTHRHSDHINSEFMKTFKGKQIDFTDGEIKGKNYYIKSIPSYHDENDKVRIGKPTNYLFVIEVAGLRIAHFGDIGISAFTEDELKSIGKIDILISQLSNSYSNMDINNEKGFKLVKQINPKILIPTHANGAIEKAVKLWNGKYSSNDLLEISKDKLPQNTTVVIMGAMKNAYKKMYNLEAF
jgi:Beta-lactamase superfamily domain